VLLEFAMIPILEVIHCAYCPHGLTATVLRNHFDDARKEAAKAMPQLAQAIKNFWFCDLRAKAADDTSDDRGDQAASGLLGTIV
jgi:hypothetical protein